MQHRGEMYQLPGHKPRLIRFITMVGEDEWLVHGSDLEATSTFVDDRTDAYWDATRHLIVEVGIY